MTAVWKDFDRWFFHEWSQKGPDDRRSLARARSVADALGITGTGRPVVEIVGSKGKGTATTYVSAVLAGSGLRTVTVSSPPFIVNNERIRIDGVQVPDEMMDSLGRRLRDAADSVPGEPHAYLSPTGSFTLAGALLAETIDADVLVLEEGLGGASDEISLFDPRVVVVTEIFEEHTDLLGGNVAEIAADLVGVVTDRTGIVVTLPQRPEVAAVIHSRSTQVVEGDLLPGSLDSGVSWPAGLSGANARAGVRGGLEMLALLGGKPDHDRLCEVLGTVWLPGRMSRHTSPAGATWTVDAAINPAGVAAALAGHMSVNGRPDAVLACFPDSKDVEACHGMLAGHNVIPVTAGTTHLRFTDRRHPSGPIPFAEAAAAVDAPGRDILAVGTMSFVGEVLGHLGIDNSVSFRTTL